MTHPVCTCGCAQATGAPALEQPATDVSWQQTSSPASRQRAGDASPPTVLMCRAVSRRTVLTGSAAVVAGLTLAACSSAADPAPAAPTPTETAAGGTGSDEEGTDGSGSGGAEGERLASTADLAVGGGVILAASVGPVVVTRPADTEFQAFSARCPHAGCPVASVAGNTITCNCHGSTFDAATGDRTGGPAPTGLTPLSITVEGDAVYLT